MQLAVREHLAERVQRHLEEKGKLSALEVTADTLLREKEALTTKVESRDQEILELKRTIEDLRERLADCMGIAEEAPTGELPKYSQFEEPDPED